MVARRVAPGITLCAVLAAKLAVVWQFRGHPMLQADAGLDTTQYVELASAVLDGKLWLGPDPYFVSPLYIYFCAAILGLSDSLLAIRVVQALLGTAAVALVFVAAKEWFGRHAAWFAAALAAGTGLFTFYEALVLQAALDPFLTAAVLAALALGLKRERPAWLLGAGLVFGIQALNRPNVLVPVVGLVLLMLLTRHRRGSLLLAAGLTAALLPVSLRNLAISGEWSPLPSHGGLNFYIGNHSDADGTYRQVPGITPSMAGQQRDARRVAEAEAGRPLTTSQVSAYFFRRGWSWITDAPADASALFARKLFLTLSSAHVWLNYSYPFFAYDQPGFLAVLFVGPWLLVPLGLVGLTLPVFGRLVPQEHTRAYLLWASFVPFYTLSVAIFFVAERYRLPLLIPFCVGSGAFIEAMRATEISRSRELALPALASLLAAVVVNWPAGVDDGRAEQRLRMAERLVARGDLDGAQRWTERALEIHPAADLVHFRVGRALAARQRPELAIPHLEKAVRAAPEQPEASYALGQALLDTGRYAAAVPHLRKAVAAGVRPDLAAYDLARAVAAIGDRGEALRILQDIRPADPNDADSWQALGRLAQQLNAPALAASFYREAANAAPRSPDPHRQLGLMLAVSGDFDAAAQAFESAAALAPRDPSVRLNLAVAYAELGRLDDAKRLAEEALRIDPSYARARDFLKALSRLQR